MFNEKANMVLSRTTEDLRNDKETCRKIGACVDKNGASGSTTNLGRNEVKKIDSLFNHYMKFYNFHIDYTFVVTKFRSATMYNENGFANYSFYKPLNDDGDTDGVELKLIFPEKKQYIMAEMGMLFITSVILILVVLIMFWRTFLSFMREKRISEHTTDFLNNMAHEFKTPLTNIALAGKMIQKDSVIREDDKIRNYIEIILDENEKLRLQIEQALSMTALEKGEIPLRNEALDFHELIQETLKCMSIQIESKHGMVKLNLDAERYAIFGDKTHLTNAMCNLIDNAIKYSNGKVLISIKTANVDNDLVIEVSDKGIGIEKEYQQKVFDKYFRVPTGDIHDVKGFGLGLAYIKKIIELHGGTIELKSEKEDGTTFKITMPNG